MASSGGYVRARDRRTRPHLEHPQQHDLVQGFMQTGERCAAGEMAGRGLGCAWQEVQRADARLRLAARCAVRAERAAAHSTQCAPEMRLEPRIAPGGGRGGRWRRSARGRSRLGCGVEDTAMGRHSAAAGGSPCGLSRACRGAFDAARAGDAARAADRRSPQEAAVVVGGAHSRVRALYRHKLS